MSVCGKHQWLTQTVNLERIQHSLAGDNQLLGLFFDGEGTNQSSDFFSSLPLGQLSKTLLTSPDRGMNNLQEQLSSPGVEDENGTVDRFGGLFKVMKVYA
jgi:hypothetical protein